ncbi:MAG: hypothetical protein K0S65_3877, partial [Labilithrix sp.]|nr:hypothetical protein [Labilithrix sp.]
MRIGWWLLVGVGTACTSANAIIDDDGTRPGESVLPDAALALDDGGDALAPDDAPCSDCEYFIDTCSPSAFCPNGPFDPNTLGGSVDTRTSITVIRGHSVSDVWAAGAVGAIAHFDGTSWTRSDSGSQETIRALWLRDSTELAVGTTFGHIFTRGVVIQDGGAVPSDGGWSAYAFPSSRPWLLFTAAWAAPATV